MSPVRSRSPAPDSTEDFIPSPTENPQHSPNLLPVCAPKLSNTEHTIVPEFSDSASSTLPTVRRRGVLHVRNRRRMGWSAHWRGSSAVPAGSVVSEALDPVDELAAPAASGRDRLHGHPQERSQGSGSQAIAGGRETIRHGPCI